MDGECAHGEDGDKAHHGNDDGEYADGEDDDDEGEEGKTGVERKSYIDCHNNLIFPMTGGGWDLYCQLDSSPERGASRN